jgi:hypothetical protein
VPLAVEDGIAPRRGAADGGEAGSR